MKSYITPLKSLLIVALLASAVLLITHQSTFAAVRAFSQQKKLTASDGAAGDSFGYVNALSADGNTLIVGAWKDDNGKGSAYVFVRSGVNWTQQAKLTASDGSTLNWFGFNVLLSADGNTAYIGSPNNSPGGSVYVFTRSGTTWTQQPKMTHPQGTAAGGFGTSLSLNANANTLLVGAIGDSSSRGSTYVYVRNGASWVYQAALTPSDGAANDNFGWSSAVSADGNTALVGTWFKDNNQGAAYVFTRTGTTWTQQVRLPATDLEALDSFGIQVALSADGNQAFVGAPAQSPKAGAVYYYTRSGATWTAQPKITAADGIAGDGFGLPYVIGNILLVGAPGRTNNQGAVYVMSNNNGTWTEIQKLTASDPVNESKLGLGIAYGNGTVAVGAYGQSNETGAVYVFTDPLLSTPTATSTTASTATAAQTSTPVSTATTQATATAEPTTIAQTSTPQSTQAVEATWTPQPTATNQSTETPGNGTELLLNGGFEVANTDWTAKNAVGDKRVCNKVNRPGGKPDKVVARTGNCAYQFKGGVGERSKLEQSIATTGISTGDTLTLSGFYRASGAVNMKVKVRVKYTDTTLETGKITLKPVVAANYTVLTGNLNVVIAAEVASVKVMLQNKSASGKVLFDDLSLQLAEGIAGFIPLP